MAQISMADVCASYHRDEDIEKEGILGGQYPYKAVPIRRQAREYIQRQALAVIIDELELIR